MDDQHNYGGAAAEIAALHSMGLPELRELYQRLHGRHRVTRNAAYLRKECAKRIQEDRFGGLSQDAKARVAAFIDERIRERLVYGAQLAAARRKALPNADAPQRPIPCVSPRLESDRDPRLPPPGTVLEREHGGSWHRVEVLAHGCRYKRQNYDSLSMVARKIAGCRKNGFAFFKRALVAVAGGTQAYAEREAAAKTRAKEQKACHRR